MPCWAWISVLVFFVAACWFCMAFICDFVLVPAGRHDGSVDPFHEVHVGHVGIDEFATRLHAVILMLHGLCGSMKLLHDRLRHVSAHFLDHFFSRTVSKGFVGHGDDGFDRFVLDARVWGPLARSVDSNECLDKVLIRKFLCLPAFGPDLDCFLERGSDFRFVACFDPLTNQGIIYLTLASIGVSCAHEN